jgi:membrane-associated phospholipid phosphatase
LLGIFLATWKIGEPSGWLWASFYVGMTILIPVSYILWKVHLGEITDFHIRCREQRIRPMALTLASAVFAWICLWLGDAPSLLVIITGVGIFQITFILLVTLSWKISGHGTAISSLTVMMVALFGSPAAPAILAIPLVAWARVRLRRHTPLQTFAGSISGILFMLVVLYLIYLNCDSLNMLCQ